MSNKAKIREDAMRLNPIDDALFVKMAEDTGFCQELLQVILGDKGLRLDESHHQHVVKNLQGRSCTLDLLCTLGSGHTVNVEVQKSDNDDHQRRVRFEGAIVTANITDPGTRFEKVPDVISIYITRFDVFNSGHTAYHVERVIRETGQVVENGFVEIYVNAQIDDGSEIAGLMKVMAEDAAYDDDRFPMTSARKRIFKTNEKGVSEMCEIIERNRQEARAEGRAEGEAVGRLASLRDAIKDGITTLTAIRASGRYTEQELAIIGAP